MLGGSTAASAARGDHHGRQRTLGKRAGWQRLRGHERGAEIARTVTTSAAKLGLERLTLYAFSSENWSRPNVKLMV